MATALSPLSTERVLKASSFIILCLISDHLFFGRASADEITTSTSGVTFGRSSREPKYNVEFHSAKSPFHPDEGQESIMMSNKDGKNYMCFLPIVEETKPVKPITQQNSSGIIVETNQRIKLKTPDELLDVLKDKCLYRHEGWWSYELCHLKHLRQLHLEDDKAVQEFYLGMFDSEATAAFNQNHSDDSLLKDPRSKDASQRYHAHQYTNGTVCDLTDRARQTEVRFVCSENTVVISSIKEISTCKYVVTVQYPLLCKHPMFQQEKPLLHTTHCNEMPGDDKDPSVAEDRVRDTRIAVITDNSDGYAT
ncbi:protein OS-9-like protein [Iris pallida]|uniref:Protein OS-9 homolog n=1 Tax=Iris pallida TaxID=29817 RepID=A0AAX6HBN5_IRIPA|nr:protein OS-9-like protein [Iris pallida]